jgi:hypothetical protein
MPYANKEDAAEWHRMHDAARKRIYRGKIKATVPTAIVKAKAVERVVIAPLEAPTPEKKKKGEKARTRHFRLAVGKFVSVDQYPSLHSDDVGEVVGHTINRYAMGTPTKDSVLIFRAETKVWFGYLEYLTIKTDGFPIRFVHREPSALHKYNAPLPQPTIERDWSKHPCRKLRHGVLRPIGVYPWDTLNKNCWSWISILADHYPEKLPRDPLAVKIGETETSSGSAWQRVNGYPAGFFPQRKSWPWGELGFFQRWDDAVRTQVDFLRKKALILPS